MADAVELKARHAARMAARRARHAAQDAALAEHARQEIAAFHARAELAEPDNYPPKARPGRKRG